MRRTLPACCVIVLALCCISSQAQGTKADYERFEKIGGITGGKVFRTKVQAHWLTGTKCFWYRNDLGHGRKNFVFVDANEGKRKAAFDHERLAPPTANAVRRITSSATCWVLNRDGNRNGQNARPATCASGTWTSLDIPWHQQIQDEFDLHS